METYRMSSKLRDEEHEYLIQTTNDTSVGAIATSIYIDGVLTETSHCPHPVDAAEAGILELVRSTHGMKKQEIESLLQVYRAVMRARDPLEMYHLAAAMYYRGFYGEARHLLESALQRSSDYHQAYNLLGTTCLALGDMLGATRAALRAVALRPKFADYHCNLGEIYLADGEPEKALEQFDVAISINLYYADAYFNRGLALLLQASGTVRKEADALLAKAVDSFTKATLVMPEYHAPSFDVGMEAIRQKDLPRALQVFRSIRFARKESKRQEMAELAARTPLLPEQISEQAMEERISSLQSEIARNPLYPDLHTDLARCYIENARIACQKATDHFKKAIDLNSSLSQNHAAFDQATDIIERLKNISAGIARKTRE